MPEKNRGANTSRSSENRFAPPSISIPKGGGAIQGIGEKFSANAVTGTAAVSVPLALSPGRSNFGPQLGLTYDSGAGNGPFGFGWNLALPSVTRKTEKGLPLYQDGIESDVFILSGAEDLQPLLVESPTGWVRLPATIQTLNGVAYRVDRYRPRIEGLFARIERWTETQSGESHWRSISRENVTTIYGKTADSRIADPSDATRIFSWLISETYDDKGNAIEYEYKRENSSGIDLTQVHERNRTATSRRANVYLKYIRYGNRVSRLTAAPGADPRWMFVAVFDYGEKHFRPLPLNGAIPADAQHRFVQATELPATPWPVRPDPFSSHKAGWDVRTYRRCHRVLMFHHFGELGDEPCLVRSIGFEYNDLDYSVPRSADEELAHTGSTRIASFIQSIEQCGHVRDESRPVVAIDGRNYVTYLQKALPPLEFEYRRPIVHDSIAELDHESLENLPAGINNSDYQWVDLDGEGISGVLSEQADTWFYKPNIGGGRFGPLQTVALKPAEGLTDRCQLLDLAGDGQLDVVAFDGPAPGFYERTDDAAWKAFRPFRQIPNIDWRDPNLRTVDLNGDGHADALITEHDVFTWYPSLAEDGFAAARSVAQSIDEEKGPRLVFADGEASVYLADMCGDGLADLVRIRNGDVCYWPNLGYGKFGAKITMDNAPRFDNPDQFDQRRVRIADIDGSGTADLIYLGRDGARIYFNQSGNRWSQPRPLPSLPLVDQFSSVSTADLFGAGISCLIWSTSALARARQPLRYIDLMGGEKPHLLTKVANNLGTEVHIHYVSSVKFYLADKAAGKPWITRLPFPVQVVDRVETYDRISRNRFVQRRAYHHGYFDGDEREFRGFGMVEQWDTDELGALTPAGDFPAGDNFDESSAVPPVYTKTWFHTGLYVGRGHVSDYYAGLLDASDTGEYYREPGLTDAQAKQLLLDDTVLPAGLTAIEEREACRSLKASMLRQEIYGADKSPAEAHPYTVVEQNFTVELVQGRGENRHAVFYTHGREALTYRYERNPSDPRVSHSLTLQVDSFGNVLQDATVTYGRRQPDMTLDSQDRAKQAQMFFTWTENRFTNAIDAGPNYRTPLPAESRAYEISGAALSPGTVRFTLAQALAAAAGAVPIEYHQAPTPGILQKRPIENVRTLYRSDDLTVPLALAVMEPRAIPFETYRLAFTPALVTAVYGARVNNALLSEAGYVHTGGDANWWTPSGQVYLSPDPAHSAAQELAYATQHFFLPVRFRDPFHTALNPTETIVTYDAHDLLALDTKDPVGNRVTAGERDAAGKITAEGNDYRVLQPTLVMDPNRNRTDVVFDALGMVVGVAVMGKPAPAVPDGDDLAGFDPNPTDAVVLAHMANPTSAPFAILGNAGTRLLYDVFAYYRTKALPRPHPAAAYTLTRETHATDPVPAGGPRFQHSFSYSDGFGREVQKKIQAEPGPVPQRDINGDAIAGPDGQPLMTPNDVAPRWVGSGWIVVNNKGKPVRQYEPFFSDTHRWEFDVHLGVSGTLFYDPLERVVATLHPDHSWDKVRFDAWRQESWDTHDTLLVADPKTDPDVGDFFRRLPTSAYLPTWHAARIGGALGLDERDAAERSAIHAATPTASHADALGRTFLVVAHNRWKYSNSPVPGEEFQKSRTIVDIEGNQREIVDARDRVAIRYVYDMLSNVAHHTSMEAGERWLLNDVNGKPVYTWDSQNRRFRTTYDRLRRPLETFLREGAAPPVMTGRIEYGETQPAPETANLRGKSVRAFDQAGVVVTDAYDFKGNLIHSTRQLAVEYKTVLDWSGPVPLRGERYTSRTRYDAVGRPVQMVAPHSDQPGANVNIVQPSWNEANLLEKVDVWLNQNAEPPSVLAPATATLHAVTDIDYDSRGRRTEIQYGNGVKTTYRHDPLTFRLRQLVTERPAALFPKDCPQPPVPAWPGCQAQNLTYTYDANGNVTRIRDTAQQTIYFRNKRVEPSADYTYDALYRLIEATGREHLGQAGAVPTPASYNDRPRTGILLSASDGNAVGRYLERFVYDEAGNIKELSHIGSDPINAGWTRALVYDEASQIEAAKRCNRLTRTTTGAATETFSTAGDGYDPHGNMLRMPHLQAMHWDYRDQLQMTARQAVNAGDDDGVAHQGERTWYVYDAAGERIRKITERPDGGVAEERVYLDGFEIYRKTGVNALVRETLHVMDDKRRVAQVETRTDIAAQPPLIRYQFGNHLGSASLELDEDAQVISYEEYTPYGSTSFSAVGNQTAAAKRFRYTGKERDEETGFYYYGARYYAPWLVRWTAPDPAAMQDATNLYLYVRCNPVKLLDPSGALSWWEEKLDEIVNPQNTVAKAVMDNLYKRGEALVNAPAAIKQVYEKEGAVGVGTAVVSGVGHLVKDTGEALGDVAYTATHIDEPGAKEKLASRSVDAVLGIADIVTIFDGAGAAKGAGTGATAVAKDVATTFKQGAKALGTGGRAFQTAEGVVVTGGKAAAATGKPLETLAQGAKATGIMMMESKVVQSGTQPPAAGTPAPSSGPVPKKIPPGVGKEPTRIKPSTVTAKPKSAAPSTWDEVALADKGMTPRAAFPTSPLHHVIPQELLKNPAIRKLLEKRGIDIDEFAVKISEGEHTAVHSVDYNQKWLDFFNRNKNASRESILKFMEKMRKNYKIDTLPYERYPR